MRPRVVLALSVALAAVIGASSVVFFEHRDDPTLGLSVRLISATGPIEPAEGMKPFVHASIRNDELHLVIRSWFHNSGSIASPHITVDDHKRGLLHVEVEHQFSIFASKCEFFRQLEIAIPPGRWKQLESLQVFNEDIDEKIGVPLSLSEPKALSALIEASRREAPIENLVGVTSGC